MILVIRVNTANIIDQNQFTYFMQLDIKEFKTYAYAIQGLNAAEQAKAIEEKLDQLEKNNTQELIYKTDMQLGYQALDRKQVYKVKQDVNDNIVRFKARQVVKSYLQQFKVDFD